MLLTNLDLLFFSTELVYLRHFVRYLSRPLLEKRYREIIPRGKNVNSPYRLPYAAVNFGVHQKVSCAIIVRLQYGSLITDELRPEGIWVRDNKVLGVLASIHLNSDWIVSLGNRSIASTRICRKRNMA